MRVNTSIHTDEIKTVSVTSGDHEGKGGFVTLDITDEHGEYFWVTFHLKDAVSTQRLAGGLARASSVLANMIDRWREEEEKKDVV